MTYQQYHDLVHHGAKLFDAGDLDGALAVFRSVVESDLPDMDKATMCINAAMVCDKKGNEVDALGWLDLGMNYEHPHMRFMVAERKAEYLTGKGRKDEARAILEELLAEPFLMFVERERLGQRLALAK